MTTSEQTQTKDKRSQAAEKAQATKRAREAKTSTFESGHYRLVKMYAFENKQLCARCEKAVSKVASVLNQDSMHTYQVCTDCACKLRGISKNQQQYIFAERGLILAKEARDKILKMKRLSCNYFNYYGVSVGGNLVIKLVVRKKDTDFKGVLQFDEPTWDQYVFPMISSLIA